MKEKGCTHEETMKDHKAGEQADNLAGANDVFAILLCKRSNLRLTYVLGDRMTTGWRYLCDRDCCPDHVR